MTNEDSQHSDAPAPIAQRVGSRFRRPLSEGELAMVVAAAGPGDGAEGLERAFRTLWDVILAAAEGVTFAEATEQGLKFDVTDYAIPKTQTQYLLDHLQEIASPFRANERLVTMLWFDKGPATYLDEMGT